MKKFIPLFLLVLFTIFLTFFFLENETKNPVPFPKHFGSVKPEHRAALELKMLMDPATGKIPDNIRINELRYASTLPKEPKNLRGGYDVWKSVGPYNIGGRTRAAAMDVSDENILIAGGISGGLFRSTNGGETWTLVSSPEMVTGTSCITQDKRTGKTHIWYAGTGERYNSAKGGGSSSLYLGDGVLKSTDGGITWDTLGNTVSNTPQTYNDFDKIWNITTNPAAPLSNDEVYVATNRNIYKSINGGTTFTSVLNSGGAGAYSYSDVICTPNGVLYATFGSDGTARGIWRSTDGESWTNITPTGWGNTYNRIVSTYNPQNDNEIYFFGNTPNSGKKFVDFQGNDEWNSFWKYTYVSGDGSGSGGNWEDRSANLPEGPHLFDDLNVQGSYNMILRVKPDDANTIFLGGTNLYRSTDAFTSPNNTKLIGGYKEENQMPLFDMYPNHHPDQHVLFFSHNDPNILFSGNDGGVFKTTDCMKESVDWISLNNGFLTTQFYTVAIDRGTENNHVIMGGLQDNGTLFTNSNNPEKDWIMSFSYDGAHCAIEDGREVYYVSIQYGRIVKVTLDEDGHLLSFRRIDPIGALNPGQNAWEIYDFINLFILDPIDQDVLYLSAGNHLWRNNQLSSINLTNEWDSISQGWEKLSFTLPAKISAFGPTYTGSKTLYVGTENGRIYKLENATTGEPTFQQISTGLPGGYVSSISVDPRNDDKVLITYSNYNIHSVHYTENGGVSWHRVSGNMEGDEPAGAPSTLYYYGPYPSCRWGQIVPIGDNKSVYLLGTSVGLFATDTLIFGFDKESDTTKWIQQAPDLIGNAVIVMMDHRTSDGFTAVASHGSGMFSGNVKRTWDITSDKVIQNQKNAFSLFPNPAKNVTNIKLNLTENSSVKIDIFELNGKYVHSVSSKTYTKGEHSISIDVSHLTNGTYLIKTTVNNNNLINKLIINR
jgi:hypothetical protein